MQQLILDVLQTAAPTLDNFVAGPNAEPLAVARSLASGSRPARTVLFHGPRGSGKSHLLTAIASSAQCAGRWLDPADPAGFDPPEGPTLLFADDVEQWGEDGLALLFLLLNLLRARGEVTVVLTSSQPPAGLGMRDDLRTRLAAGLVMGLRLLDDEDKKLALRHHASARGIRPDDQINDWLLAHQDRDIRHLLAYLEALDRYALASHRPISLRLLHDFERNGRPSTSG